MTGFQLFGVNRDGCHMWGRKCSLFPEHLISLPLGVHDFTPFGSSWFHSLWEFMISPIHYMYIIYYWICQFQEYVYRLIAWISLTVLSLELILLQRISKWNIKRLIMQPKCSLKDIILAKPIWNPRTGEWASTRASTNIQALNGGSHVMTRIPICMILAYHLVQS